MLKLSIKYSPIFFFALLLLIPQFSHAAGLVPCGGPGENPCGFLDIFVLIARLTNWLIRIAGIYAVYQIILAGFNLVTAMGNEEKLTQNKSMITNAVVGFCLVTMSYLFVNFTVNYLLLRGLPNCKIDISRPGTYLNIDSGYFQQCRSDFDKAVKDGTIQ